jgi:glycerol-1-phosphate dehydrogenase [NAD(P)+]
VGVATYLVACLQAQNTERIAGLFATTGFWRAIAADPFRRSDWIEAARIAPTVKPGFYTVLSSRDCMAEIEHLLATDRWLQACFV